MMSEVKELSKEELQSQVERLASEVQRGNQVIQVMQNKIGRLEGENALILVDKMNLESAVRELQKPSDSE